MDPSQPPVFTAGENGSYTFNTGVLKGKLRSNGKSLGLTSVVHIPTGMLLDRSNGFLGYYRIFTTRHRFGTGAWDWPSQAQLLPDGAVAVQWPAAAAHPFELKAVYRWHDAATLDVETTVKAQTDLPDFEVFLASYFNDTFTNCLVYTKADPEKADPPGFLPAKAAFGDWQMFPRDVKAVRLIGDGRWGIEPNPVKWVILPPFAAPIAQRREDHHGVTAVLMAPVQDCFDIATPQQTEGHYSLYFSLFGKDLKTGESVRAHTRLWISTAPSQSAILEAYSHYIHSVK